MQNEQLNEIKFSERSHSAIRKPKSKFNRNKQNKMVGLISKFKIERHQLIRAQRFNDLFIDTHTGVIGHSHLFRNGWKTLLAYKIIYTQSKNSLCFGPTYSFSFSEKLKKKKTKFRQKLLYFWFFFFLLNKFRSLNHLVYRPFSQSIHTYLNRDT